MLMVADIPPGRLPFTGIVGVVLLRKKYRSATCLGAKAVKNRKAEELMPERPQARADRVSVKGTDRWCHDAAHP